MLTQTGGRGSQFVKIGVETYIDGSRAVVVGILAKVLN